MEEKTITIKMTESEFEELLDKLRFIRDEIIEKSVKAISSILVNLEQQAQEEEREKGEEGRYPTL